MRVLIVDDNKINRRFLESLLNKHADCYMDVNGKDAINTFEKSLEDKKYFDVILMDVMMPEVDGLQALNIIRDIERKMNIPKEDAVKVVVISALNNIIEVEMMLDEEKELFIHKPIQIEELIFVFKKLNIDINL